MRREGRQHGMVRNYANGLSSVPTAGLFAKVSSKPSNHSKFTGRCGRCKCYGCHSHPVSKCKDKVKGAQKMRSFSDMVSNHRLITWRVVNSTPGFKVSGFSATGVLDYLDRVDDYDYDYEGLDDDLDCGGSYDHEIEEDVDVDVDDVVEEDDDDDGMSFCEVGFVWQAVDGDGDESWCLVEEI